MGEPCPVRHPASALEVLRRAAAVDLQRERIVLGVFGEVRVQADIESFGELGRTHHQLLGHRERRARSQRDALVTERPITDIAARWRVPCERRCRARRELAAVVRDLRGC